MRGGAARFSAGLVLALVGGYLAMSPLLVADVLQRPHETTSQLINLRASWGGPVIGLGLFVAWLPALRPWSRTSLGLVLWAMAGIAAARALGFVLDGSPDSRQWLWMTLEVTFAIGAALGLRALRRRAGR